MTTAAYEGPSSAELELLLRAAARCGSPREQGRAQARRTSDRVLRGLTGLAAVVAAYDLVLLCAAR